MKEMNYHEQERQGLAAATSSSNNGFDWFDESMSSFLAAGVDLGGGDAWWAVSPAAQQDDIGSVVAQTLSPPPAAPAATSPLAYASPGIASPAASSPSEWPTLLESLTRQPGGRAPPSVRLTVAGPEATSPAPFSASPPGYDFSPHLLRYAKSINLELDIGRAATLDAVQGFCTPGEALVVCLQFRLGHTATEERRDILRKVIELKPELVVLSELDSGGDGSASGEFAARLELLWRFLESTSAAFKGKDVDERRLLENEAGTSLATDVAGEGREGWRERMAAAGFEEASFGAEAVESAKSLLRKYDGGWDMATVVSAAGAGAVALRWKGQPVSFCSLWRPTP
uniref:Uncharacterized protein n=1 Tax=Oryza brachyantha TaxID=4533 RepID=J3LPN7_ORYBR